MRCKYCNACNGELVESHYGWVWYCAECTEFSPGAADGDYDSEDIYEGFYDEPVNPEEGD